MVAVVLLSGCAGVRQRLLGRGVVRAPVELPEDAEAARAFPPRTDRAHAERRADRGEGVREGDRRRSSRRPWLRLRLAQLYVRQGRLDAQRIQSRWSTAAEPTTSTRSALQGGVLSALGRDAEAVAATSACSRSTRTSRRRTSTWARSTEARRPRPAPSRSLKKLIARNPTSILGYYYLGRVHAGARQLDKAERYYLEALKLSPQSELILTDLAVTYEAQGKSQKAIELYERILAANPESVVVRRRLGAIYVGQKRFERRAEAVPRDRADRRRSARRAHEDRAHLLREGRRSSARRPSSTWCSPPTRRTTASATTSASRTPSSARPSRALDELGARRRQVRLLRRSARAARDAPPEGRPRRAVKEIEATLAREARLARPDELTSASLYREQKRYPKADRDAREAWSRRFPDNDRYRFTLGAAYDEANDREQRDRARCSARSSSTRRTPRRSTTSATRTPTWA